VSSKRSVFSKQRSQVGSKAASKKSVFSTASKARAAAEDKAW